IFKEMQLGSHVSGLLWNAALGKQGYPVFKQIEFEGKGNIEGELEREGILTHHPYIQAICFMGYSLSTVSPTVIGFYNNRTITDASVTFLNSFCDFTNDDLNSYGFQIDDNGRKLF